MKSRRKVLMYNIDFYKNERGDSDVLVFLESLRAKLASSKDARIQYSQITRYIELLQINGTNLPSVVVKHLEGDIWELRPGNNRVLFFSYHKGTFVLLHHFRKKTQKTPRKEISLAIFEMKDYISRKESENELE